MINRWVGAAGCLVLGLVIGVMGAFVQAQRLIVEMAGSRVVVPWGVALVWIALLAAVRAGAWALRTRWGSWAVLSGWLTATILMATESASGDLALSGGGRQLTYLFGGVVLGSAAATLPVPRHSSDPGSIA